MAKAVVDPQELRRFAQDLKRFNEDLHNNLSVIHGRMVALSQTWLDQEESPVGCLATVWAAAPTERLTVTAIAAIRPGRASRVMSSRPSCVGWAREAGRLKPASGGRSPPVHRSYV